MSWQILKSGRVIGEYPASWTEGQVRRAMALKDMCKNIRIAEAVLVAYPVCIATLIFSFLVFGGCR